MDSCKNTIPILLGPTATGKTSVSIALAKKINAEIISADSRLVYRYMDIGTAKPSLSEMQDIPHHLIDLVNPDENFTVAGYKKLAYKKIDEILATGKIPLVVGGTGLYIRALVDNPSFQNLPPDPDLRSEILREIDKNGSQAVYRELAELDPDAAEKIHPNNIPRLVRAIEVVRSKNVKFSESVRRDRERTGDENPYSWVLVGLNMDREVLYKRINGRVKLMIDAGWVDEVKKILDMGYTGSEKPLLGLGYRDIISLIKGEIDLNAAIENIAQDTRRFAKRQMTFFRKIPGIHWIELEEGCDTSDVVSEILESSPLNPISPQCGEGARG
ncbi:MAG: tRNA (adenosine(37)-N6)-dimethylallyltransferase MiaA [bacterium]|nr:tRNA (adenosine(37)-N6)-dimethylallyltransferase MiaA [bacterium]